MPGGLAHCYACYVYYRVAEADLAGAQAAVQVFQRELLASHPALQAALMRRPEVSEGLVTLMETYQSLAPLPAALRERIAAGPAALRPWLRGERHLEEFVPCA